MYELGERKRYEKMEKDIRIESQLLDLEKMVRMRIETVVRFFFLPSSLSLFLSISFSRFFFLSLTER